MAIVYMTHPIELRYRPLKLVGLFDMLKFDAAFFVGSGHVLQKTQQFLESGDFAQEGMAAACAGWCKEFEADLKKHGFAMSVVSIERLIYKLESKPFDVEEVRFAVRDLADRVRDELDGFEFVCIDKMHTEFWEQSKPLFGPEVPAKFPNCSEDIAEAGKCIAVGRYTAAVFHLMRMMEDLTQQLGTILGVQLANEKNWQNILDEANKALKALPPKDVKTIALASVCSYLYGVKLAWRNEVMHPKATYTEEEALDVIANCKSFAREFAKVV